MHVRCVLRVRSSPQWAATRRPGGRRHLVAACAAGAGGSGTTAPLKGVLATPTSLLALRPCGPRVCGERELATSMPLRAPGGRETAPPSVVALRAACHLHISRRHCGRHLFRLAKCPTAPSAQSAIKIQRPSGVLHAVAGSVRSGDRPSRLWRAGARHNHISRRHCGRHLFRLAKCPTAPSAQSVIKIQRPSGVLHAVADPVRSGHGRSRRCGIPYYYAEVDACGEGTACEDGQVTGGLDGEGYVFAFESAGGVGEVEVDQG